MENVLPTLLSGVAATVVTTAAGFLFRWAKAMTRSQMLQMRTSIQDIYDRSVARGYVTQRDLKHAVELYSSYKDLGGNSWVHSLMEQLEEMPKGGAPLPQEGSKK